MTDGSRLDGAWGVMILPMITSLCDDALRAVPQSLRNAGYALGATDFEVSTQVVLPGALSGVIRPEASSTALPFVIAICWLALALSIGAVSLLFILIKHGEATRVSSLFYLTPLATAAMAWFAFEEHLDAIALAGMVIGVTGVALVLRKPDIPATEI